MKTATEKVRAMHRASIAQVERLSRAAPLVSEYLEATKVKAGAERFLGMVVDADRPSTAVALERLGLDLLDAQARLNVLHDEILDLAKAIRGLTRVLLRARHEEPKKKRRARP